MQRSLLSATSDRSPRATASRATASNTPHTPLTHPRTRQMWEDDDHDDFSENDPPPRQPQKEEEQREERQQTSPTTPEEADALRNRVRGELVNLCLWLLAYQGWRELHGKLVPREEDRGAGSSGSSSKPLDLRGPYEYMRGHLELFRDFPAFFYEPGSNEMTPTAVQFKNTQDILFLIPSVQLPPRTALHTWPQGVRYYKRLYRGRGYAGQGLLSFEWVPSGMAVYGACRSRPTRYRGEHHPSLAGCLSFMHLKK